MDQRRAAEDADSLEIVSRIKRGERELAAALYERYVDRLYGYLCSILDDRKDAEDITHQVFETMLRKLSEYESRADASFRSWLFALARNCAADHQRKHGRVELTAPYEMRQQMADLPSGHGDVELSLSWVSNADLMAALRRLPPLPREVVLLRYVGDFELAEIASVMSVSEDSVKQAHRRALIALSERLGSSAPGGGMRQRPISMRRLTSAVQRLCGHSFSPTRP